MGLFGRGCGGSRSGQRGDSNIGCIILLAIIALLAWVGFKIGKVYFDRQSLKEAVVREIALFQAKSDDELRQILLLEAEQHSVPIGAEDIEIVRPNKARIRVHIQWDVDVAFPMDKHFRRTMMIDEEAHTIQ